LLAEQLRSQIRTYGLTAVSQFVAITDGGQGLEEARRRHRAEDRATALGWYHAAEYLSDAGREALLDHWRGVALPPVAGEDVWEELRQLIGYFEGHRHRTDYPAYRAKAGDIGSGPTEAGCKIIGKRLKGSGRRWAEDRAATVGALRALSVSGSKVWDGFGSQPHALVS
jgi:hypothetical protein